MAKDTLAELLLSNGLVDKLGRDRARQEQERWGGDLGRYLVDLGFLDEETLIRAYSTLYRLPAVALDPPKMNRSAAKMLARSFCEANALIAFRADVNKKTIDIAMADPSNLRAIDEVRVITKYTVRPHIAARSAIDRAISEVFFGSRPDYFGGELDLESMAAPARPVAPQPGNIPAGYPMPGNNMTGPYQPVPQVPPGMMPPPMAAPAPPPQNDRQFRDGEVVGIRGRRASEQVAAKLDSLELLPQELAQGMAEAKPVSASPSAEELEKTKKRMERLEKSVAQTRSILEKLLRELIRKELFTKEEILKILKG